MIRQLVITHWNKTLNKQYKYKVDTYVGENYKNNKNTVQNNWNTNSVFITKCLIWGNNFKRYIDLCEAPTLFSEKSLWACTVDNQKWKQNQVNPYCYFQQINEQLSTSEGLYCMLSGKLLFQGSQEILPQSNHDSSTQPLCTLQNYYSSEVMERITSYEFLRLVNICTHFGMYYHFA